MAIMFFLLNRQPWIMARLVITTSLTMRVAIALVLITVDAMMAAMADSIQAAVITKSPLFSPF